MNLNSAARTRRWLVVDDDAALAEITALTLDSLGLAKVEFCTSALEALAYLAGAVHDYDLVLTDRDMPGIDGLSFARRLHSAAPRVKIILITAHSDDLSSRDLFEAGICSVIAKPFPLSRLEKAIAQIATPILSPLPTLTSAFAGVSTPTMPHPTEQQAKAA